MKHVAFRVDASSKIGTGHLMRCLSLADELKRLGGYTRFVSRHMPDHLRDLLTAKGHEFALLGSQPVLLEAGDLAHSQWLETTQESDAQDAIQVLSDHDWDWLVVDHYALDARWESLLRQTASRILVIDDLADRQHDSDVLLDQNYYADMNDRYVGKVPDHCRPLLGPRYALLREEFRQLREQVSPRKGVAQRILVFFGGVDADNYTGPTIQALADMGIPDIHVDVVIGSQHPFRKAVEAACAHSGFSFHVQTDRMAELMAAADISIGAGGSATWERCCLGLPTIAVCVAENQRKQLEDAALDGLICVPELNDRFGILIGRHVQSLMENRYLRQFISGNCLRAVDGKGVRRVMAAMGCSEIEIRTANPDDSENLFKWRNHPSIRTVSRNSDRITREDHNYWFSSVLGDRNRVLLIGELGGDPVGVVRFDIQNSDAEVSIYLVPDANQSGRGRELLQSAELWFSNNRPEIRHLTAHVLGANMRSNRLFLDAGYKVESTAYFKRLH